MISKLMQSSYRVLKKHLNPREREVLLVGRVNNKKLGLDITSVECK